MEALCPSCQRPFEPAVVIAGARCPACLARAERVLAGDRYGRPQFRQGPGWVEFDRVPPQPRAAAWAGALVVAVAVLVGWLAIAGLGHAPHRPPDLGRSLLAGVTLGGLAALLALPLLLPAAFRMRFRATAQGLELRRAGRRRRLARGRLVSLRARETPLGHGLAVQLADGTSWLLAQDLPEPDDALRLATALREVLQLPASEPLSWGARPLEAGPAGPHGEVELARATHGVELTLRGLRGTRLHADDDRLRITRRLARPTELLADDVRALDAEVLVSRPGAPPRYRVVASLRRGRRVVADRLQSPEAARFIRDALARALRL